jgi:DNA-directed RNA polymerase specialized sigma24 family protein
VTTITSPAPEPTPRSFYRESLPAFLGQRDFYWEAGLKHRAQARTRSGSRTSREMLAADDKELGKLLVASMPTLRAFVRRRVADRETANEVLQEVSLRALSGDGPLDRGSFASWSCGIARHVIGMEWRRCRRVREEQPIDGLDLDGIRDPVSPPDQRFDARASLRRVIGDDIEGVALLFRRYLDRVSGTELAAELGLTPAALRMRLMRIRSSARARSDDA